jgi:hypothetical protein
VVTLGQPLGSTVVVVLRLVGELVAGKIRIVLRRSLGGVFFQGGDVEVALRGHDFAVRIAVLTASFLVSRQSDVGGVNPTLGLADPGLVHDVLGHPAFDHLGHLAAT